MRRGAAIAVTFIAGVLLYYVTTPRTTLYDAVVAVASSAIAAALFGWLCVARPGKALNPLRWLIGVAYVLKYLFIIEPRHHLNVSAMILGLKKYKPGLVRVPHTYLTEFGVAAAANSITNTPGTLVVDVDEGRREFLVHWLEAWGGPGEAPQILAPFDRWIKDVFEG